MYFQANNQTFFRAGEVLWNQDTSINFVKKARKKDPAGENLEFFLLDTPKTTFWMKDSTQGWTQLGPFFQNQGTFFDFQKRVGEASPTSPSPSCKLDLYDCSFIILLFNRKLTLEHLQINRIGNRRRKNEHHPAKLFWYVKSSQYLHNSGKLNINQRQLPEVFYKTRVLKNFAKFTGKHQCYNLFLNKVAGLRLLL